MISDSLLFLQLTCDMLGHLIANDQTSTQTDESIKGIVLCSCHKQASGLTNVDSRIHTVPAEIFLSPFLGFVSCIDFIIRQAPFPPWQAGLQYLQVSILPASLS